MAGFGNSAIVSLIAFRLRMIVETANPAKKILFWRIDQPFDGIEPRRL